MTEESQGNNHNNLNNNVQAEPPLPGLNTLRKQHEQVVKDCEGRIQHWKKVAGDYQALDERLKTLPDQLSYDVMVPFGPLAFMPGKMVHTNEVTVLLGDNWFAKCSAKQAQKIVDHRMKYVEGELGALHKTMKNFESRFEFTKGLEDVAGNKYDIREEVENTELVTKGKRRMAHKPNSKPKVDTILNLPDEKEENEGCKYGVLSKDELWVRLDELEKLEEEEEREELEKGLEKQEEPDGEDRMLDTVDINAEDTMSSSEEEKEGDGPPPQTPSWNCVPQNKQVNGKAPPPSRHKMEEEDDGDSCLPTIYFSHTVEPKKVRINTGKNTTLKFSERKEQKEHSKKKKNGHSNGHSYHEVHKITTPADIYRLFVDVRNGEPVPRKSILKSRSRESSVCSDTSESSAADFEERRVVGRSFSHDEHSDTSDGITEEDSPTAVAAHPPNRFEAFSGTVVEKDPISSAVPHLTIVPPALPTIPERKQEEVTPDVPPSQEAPKRVSKFKAARLQQK